MAHAETQERWRQGLARFFAGRLEWFELMSGNSRIGPK
ncbi:hypothetical protein PspCFBP13509_09335 [Pseudomonas sp. CFBP13509]|nr:DUF2550 family protein [Pseudomonas sp. P42]TKJ80423.1 hypothetical protein PspCFBP13509_09335 [Pseudomonas sp. CFBP13509]